MVGLQNGNTWRACLNRLKWGPRNWKMRIQICAAYSLIPMVRPMDFQRLILLEVFPLFYVFLINYTWYFFHLLQVLLSSQRVDTLLFNIHWEKMHLTFCETTGNDIKTLESLSIWFCPARRLYMATVCTWGTTHPSMKILSPPTLWAAIEYNVCLWKMV
jgi:hypothetical protein